VHELAQHGAASIYACSNPNLTSNLTTAFESLKEDVAKQSPHTNVIPYPLETSSEPDTLALIDEILNSYGRLDVWVCSSGLLGPASMDATTPEHLQKCFEANSLAPFFALKYGKPAMIKTMKKGNYPNAAPKDGPYGSIVVVSSVASTYGGKWNTCAEM